MAKRLIKIAKELNVGTATIVEHLAKKGFDIENKPTAKITDAMHEELLKEFQRSIAIKEKADQLVIGNRVTNRKESAPAKVDQKSSPKEQEKTTTELFKSAPTPPVQPKETVSPTQNKVVDKKTVEASKEKAKPADQKSETVKEEKAKIQLKIKGKIDLDKKRTPAEKSTEKEEVKSQPEAKTPEPQKTPAKPEAKKEEVLPESKKAISTPAPDEPKKVAEKSKPQEDPSKSVKKEVQSTKTDKPAQKQKEEEKASAPVKQPSSPVSEKKAEETLSKASREKAEPKQKSASKEESTPKKVKPKSTPKDSKGEAKEQKPKPVEQKAESKKVEPSKTEDQKPSKEGKGGEEEGASGESEFLRAETPQLKGLKILGKIDTDRFKKPRKKKKKDEKGPDRDKAPRDDRGKQRSRTGESRTEGSNNKDGASTDKPGRRNDRDQRRSSSTGNRNNRPERQSDGSGSSSRRRDEPTRPGSRTERSESGTGTNNRGTGTTEKGKGEPQSTSQQGDDSKKKRPRKRKKVPARSTTGGSGNYSDSSGSGPRRERDDRRGGRRRPTNKKEETKEVSKKEIEDQIKATMARMSGGGKKKRQKLRRETRERQREKQEQLAQEAENDSTLHLTEFVTVSELASLMNVAVTDVITTCMNLGVIVSINQRLDAEIIELVTEEFGFEVDFISAEEQDVEEEEEEDDPDDLEPRAPIVTVMGHVDHGKTSLLDYIRKANVAEGEAGGITQHIGAYEVKVADGKRITFLDTPGHEAFTAMRARGAKVTDVAVVIISADDNVMPQTKEAISHAQAAGVPIVFAINKIDKPGAQPERIKQELANMNLLVEDWGGSFQSQDISAKNGTNIEPLLEKVLLEAEMLELKANPDRKASGVVLEASLDKGRGYVAKFLVQNGMLEIGDPIVAGEHSGKVKAMFNERGKRVKKAGPSQPVLILGLSGAPQAGEKFKEMDSEPEARQIAAKRAQISREQANRASKRISLDEIGRRLSLGTFKELNLIVKGDVDGSVEALSDSLIKLSIETVQVNVIHKAVGQIIESDILLASASDAIVIGFQVRPSIGARRLAEREGVQITTYSIIYEAIEEIKLAIEGMLEPTQKEEIIGQLEVREVYKISKVGTVAGCYVQEGKIHRNSNIRLIRDGIVIYPTKEGVTAELASLKRFKDDAKEVKNGMECGLTVKNFNDIKVGDNIEVFEIVEVKQKLEI